MARQVSTPTGWRRVEHLAAPHVTKPGQQAVFRKVTKKVANVEVVRAEHMIAETVEEFRERWPDVEIDNLVERQDAPRDFVDNPEDTGIRDLFDALVREDVSASDVMTMQANDSRTTATAIYRDYLEGLFEEAAAAQPVLQDGDEGSDEPEDESEAQDESEDE